jgi:hypothetical protein
MIISIHCSISEASASSAKVSQRLLLWCTSCCAAAKCSVHLCSVLTVCFEALLQEPNMHICSTCSRLLTEVCTSLPLLHIPFFRGRCLRQSGWRPLAGCCLVAWLTRLPRPQRPSPVWWWPSSLASCRCVTLGVTLGGVRTSIVGGRVSHSSPLDSNCCFLLFWFACHTCNGPGCVAAPRTGLWWLCCVCFVQLSGVCGR